MSQKNDYSKFIAVSRYAKWLDKDARREQWGETVDRYMTNVVKPVVEHLVTYQEEDVQLLGEYIKEHKVMPSMRALMAAGPALDRDNTCGYNCAYLPVDDLRSFDEALFILMCGTGVGFSVEAFNTTKLPVVPRMGNVAWYQKLNPLTKRVHITVADSKEGWAQAFQLLIKSLWMGIVPTWDLSKLRPAGAKLKTFGGRSSGPEPLNDLFVYTVAMVLKAQGRQLTPRECHDIMCKIGEVVVVGGVRRSAMISLSDIDDIEMAMAKAGDWWTEDGQRALANNSVGYTQKPNAEDFLKEWHSLVASKSGERGIFNREASHNQAAKYGRRKLLDSTSGLAIQWGTNPCSEIILRPYQFCNLTEVVIRAEDTVEDLVEKVMIATILGTIQSTYVDFPYLRPIWHKNTAEERLLGVSLTGIMDNPIMTTANPDLQYVLEGLREVAVEVNKALAEMLDIPASAAITCVKPSGTVSQLVDSASGIHARHNNYYIRTVRADRKDPLTQFMIDQGIPWEPCVMKPDTTIVFSFPMAAPEGAVTRNDMDAIGQLEMWLMYQRYWCEHKPSVTISVKDVEWVEVGQFVYKHFDEMSGVSFLPHTDHTYQQAPYQDITREEYFEWMDRMPKAVDWTNLASYETEDTTKGSQTMACSGGSCEIVDI